MVARVAGQERSADAIPVAVLPDGEATLRPAAGVIFLDIDGGVLLAAPNRPVDVGRRGRPDVACASSPPVTAPRSCTTSSTATTSTTRPRRATSTRVLTDLSRRGLIAEHDTR